MPIKNFFKRQKPDRYHSLESDSDDESDKAIPQNDGRHDRKDDHRVVGAEGGGEYRTSATGHTSESENAADQFEVDAEQYDANDETPLKAEADVRKPLAPNKQVRERTHQWPDIKKALLNLPDKVEIFIGERDLPYRALQKLSNVVAKTKSGGNVSKATHTPNPQRGPICHQKRNHCHQKRNHYPCQ